MSKDFCCVFSKKLKDSRLILRHLHHILCIFQIVEENGLSGTLPMELKELSVLKRLALQKGNLQSTIPLEYSSLRNLLVLGKSISATTFDIGRLN